MTLDEVGLPASHQREERAFHLTERRGGHSGLPQERLERIRADLVMGPYWFEITRV